jgi:hypothetical protein
MEKAAKRETADGRPTRPAKAAQYGMTSATKRNKEETATHRVLIHKIEDEAAGDDTESAAAPVRIHTPQPVGPLPYAGSVAANRTPDIRPPYTPSYALRRAIERAREVQPPLLSMAGGELAKY